MIKTDCLVERVNAQGKAKAVALRPFVPAGKAGARFDEWHCFE